MSIDIM
jgi:hypothetical protein